MTATATRQPFDLPDTIPLSKIRAFVADLGIPTADLRALTCDQRGIYVEVYARNRDGQRYVGPDGSTAMHHLAVPLDRRS